MTVRGSVSIQRRVRADVEMGSFASASREAKRTGLIITEVGGQPVGVLSLDRDEAVRLIEELQRQVDFLDRQD